MLGIPIENDALHAMLRICLRMTRKYDNAVTFANLGGIKLILNLTYASHFAGFVSLSTLLIRHVIEEPMVLRQAMEKVSY
jgi:E3 ubiquitin-protein ligase HUWE1